MRLGPPSPSDRGVRDGGSIFQIRGSRARGDEEDGPPRRRRKVQREYQGGSTYVGEALGKKRDGQGKLTFPSGEEWDGVFVDDKFDKGTAKNMKVNGGGTYTGQIVGGDLNGPGKMTFADGGELRGNFLNGKLDEGTATDYKHSNDDTYIGPIFDGPHYRFWSKLVSAEYTYTGRIFGGTHNGHGKLTFAELDECREARLGQAEGVYVNGQLSRGKVTFSRPFREVREGIFVDRHLHGPGTQTFADGEVRKGDFVRGLFQKGTVTNWKYQSWRGGFDTYTGQVITRGSLMRHGAGKMTFANGDVWEGHFSMNWYNEGKFTLANGEEVKNYRIGTVYLFVGRS